MRHDSLSRLKTDHTRVSHFGLQKLPEGILRRLGLVQSKTRYLPLHLHSRRIVLPGVKGHSDITVSCPFPKYFTNTLKRLQIPLPGKEWDGSQLAALFEKVLHLDLILTVEKVMYKADITLLCILNVFCPDFVIKDHWKCLMKKNDISASPVNYVMTVHIRDPQYTCTMHFISQQ